MFMSCIFTKYKGEEVQSPNCYTCQLRVCPPRKTVLLYNYTKYICLEFFKTFLDKYGKQQTLY